MMSAYRALAGAFIRSRLAYRASFLARLLAVALADLTPILLIGIVLTRFPSVAGWRWPELALLYGLMQTSASLARALSVPLDHFDDLIVSGGLDTILCRPVSPLGHVLAGGVELMQASRIGVGIAALALALPAAGVPATAANLGLVVAAVAGGAMILFALTWMIASFSFWAGRTGKLDDMVMSSARSFAEYPLAIFPRSVRAALTFVLPVALASYYPALRLLDRGGGALAFAALPMGLLFLAIGLAVWRLGLRRYASTGS
jgi:ABC-2 type transport system permease protein